VIVNIGKSGTEQGSVFCCSANVLVPARDVSSGTECLFEVFYGNSHFSYEGFHSRKPVSFLFFHSELVGMSRAQLGLTEFRT